MRFIGIDPSLTGTGIVCLNEEGEIVGQELIKTTTELEIEDRLIVINKKIKRLLDDKYQIICDDGYIYDVIVYIEGISFGAKGNAVMQLAGLHYFLRIQLRNRFNLKYDIIPPTTLKKFITCKGNAKKELMLLNVYKRWGVEYKNNNLADAYSLARMALDKYNEENIHG